MTIINIDPAALIPYPGNAKKHDARQVANVAESMRRYGIVQPLVIDKENVIVIGHCRALAAQQLGLASVPCVRVDELTPEEVNALRIIDNKTNESIWDFDMLAGELEGLDLGGFDFDWEQLSASYGTDFQLPDGDERGMCQMTFTLAQEQKSLIEAALDAVGDSAMENYGNTNANGNALYEVIRQWATQKGLS